MATLKVINNQTVNPIAIDLSFSFQADATEGMDPYDPAFTDKVISHSLLKEGGVLALEDLKNKELVFPLALNDVSNSAVVQQVVTLNQALVTPGTVLLWQDDDLSQPTIFDGISGQFDVEYSYRQQQQNWIRGKLRFFAQPFGHTASPRRYATASGVGPLLMISPYAAGGALSVAASTQAGVAGFGGKPYGASTGVFYWGSPSLAGDAPAQLQISYVGPLPNTSSNSGVVPYVAVSVLPDQYYNPLIPAPQITHGASTVLQSQQTSVASQYLSLLSSQTLGAAGANQPKIDTLAFSPVSASVGIEPTGAYAGNHRLLTIARASTTSGGSPSFTATLALQPGVLSPGGASTVIGPGDWQLYDLGVVTLRASEYPQQQVNVLATAIPVQSTIGASTAGTLDVAAFVMLPDSNTWFLNPNQIESQASQYGYPPAIAQACNVPSSAYTNTFVLDDTLSDQFIYAGLSQTSAPSPAGSVPSSARITQFSRGLMSRPDPKSGIPIIAIVGVGQISSPTVIGGVNTASPIAGGWMTRVVTGGSWSNPQNLRTMAQVNVLERTRYVLP